jgi:hypothetical protein
MRVAAFGGAAVVLGLGAVEGFAGGVGVGGEGGVVGVLAVHGGVGGVEFGGGSRSGLCVGGVEVGAGPAHRVLGVALGGEGQLVGRVGAFLVVGGDAGAGGAGGVGVLGGTADQAGVAVLELGGEFGGDAGDAGLARVVPGLAGVGGRVAGGTQAFLGPLEGLGVVVAGAGGVELAACLVAGGGEFGGAGAGGLGGVEALPQRLAGGLPAVEPGVGVRDELLGPACLALQAVAFGGQFGCAVFGAPGLGEGAEFLTEPVFVLGELAGPGFGESVRQTGPGGPLGGLGGGVLAGGLLPQVQGGFDGGGSAGLLQPGAGGVAFGAYGGQFGGAADGGGVPLLEGVQLPYGVGLAPGSGVRRLGLAQGGLGDAVLFAGGGAQDGGPLEDVLGEFGVTGRPVRGRFGAFAGRLLHAVGEVDQFLVAGADVLFGGAAAVAEPVLDGLEAAGVEEPPQQRGPLGGPGAQEARELALRQQHDLAELLLAHADEPQQLLADLLVGLGQRSPLAAGVLAQQRDGLVGGHAGAAFLGSQLLGAAGDLQPPPADSEVEDDLRGRVGVGVVAAQPGERAGARHASVEREAHAVQDGGLAGAGRAVQQEDPGGGQLVEVDALAAGEGAEGGEGEAVQAHQLTSARTSAARTASRASLSTSRSRGSGAEPRTWVTKSSAICWSVRPRSRWAYEASGSSPVRSGSKARARACGKRLRSRAMGSCGRCGSVRVASTQESSCRSWAGSASRSSRRPRSRASGRGTGQATRSAVTAPSAPRSTSHMLLRCSASEKEYASGEPEYRTRSVIVWQPCRCPRAT